MLTHLQTRFAVFGRIICLLAAALLAGRHAQSRNITTVAGAGNQGYNGDGIAATSAQLSRPGGVVLDGSSNFFIADQNNHLVRKASENLPPTLVGGGLTSPQSATVGVAFSIPTAYAFQDPEGRPLRFISSPLPAGLSLNTSTGLISGTPLNSGTAGITVGVTDDGGATVYSGFFLTIQAAVGAPVVVGSGLTSPQSATVGVAFFTSTAYVFSDPSGRPLRFISSPLPAGLSLNPATGVISGVPVDAGTAGITVGATNENNLTVYSGFFLSIRLDSSVNQPPRVVGNGIGSPSQRPWG